jgi:hypothetical protein
VAESVAVGHLVKAVGRGDRSDAEGLEEDVKWGCHGVFQCGELLSGAAGDELPPFAIFLKIVIEEFAKPVLVFGSNFADGSYIVTLPPVKKPLF